MTAAAPLAANLLPGRPVRQFGEQMLFLVMVWAGFALSILILTFCVSLFREIEISGWAMGSSAARWFVFAIACYFAYSVLPLHVVHGQTRRDFAVRFAAFVPLYSGLAAMLVVLTFSIEGAFYGLMGWPQNAPGSGASVNGLLSGPVAFLQNWLIMMVWGAAGAAIAAGWYRNGWLGMLLTIVGVCAAMLSALLLDEREGPASVLSDWLIVEPSAPLMLAGHLALLAAFSAVFWRVARDMPVHTKSEDA